MTRSNPLVSVVVGAFNAGPFIESTLRSVLNQEYSNLEVLVIDDRSTDDTCARVTDIARMDSRVRLFAQPVNSGRPAVPRNQGIKEARGELVAFLDADDLWTRWKLLDQVRAMAANPDLVLVYSMFESIGDVTRLSTQYGVKPLPFQPALTRTSLERDNAVTCSSALSRLPVVRELGGFDEDPRLSAVEDYDLWLRLSGRGPIGFIPRIHGFYRVHASGISRTVHSSSLVPYLFEKRAITTVTRGTPERSLPGKWARFAVHCLSLLLVRAAERMTRRLFPGKVFVWRKKEGTRRRGSQSPAPGTLGPQG